MWYYRLKRPYDKIKNDFPERHLEAGVSTSGVEVMLESYKRHWDSHRDKGGSRLSSRNESLGNHIELNTRALLRSCIFHSTVPNTWQFGEHRRNIWVRRIKEPIFSYSFNNSSNISEELRTVTRYISMTGANSCSHETYIPTREEDTNQTTK